MAKKSKDSGLINMLQDIGIVGPHPPKINRQKALDTAALGTAPIPILGDVAGVAADVNRYATDPKSRKASNYLLSAAGALPMVPSVSPAFRLASRADKPRIEFHDSPSPKPIDVTGEGRFGGIFAGPSGGRGGRYRHALALDPKKVLNTSDLSRMEGVDSQLKAIADVEGDDFKKLKQAVVGDESFLDMNLSPEDTKRLFGTSDMTEAAFRAQKMRGELARKLGAQAVEMGDETGTSLLVLPGARTIPLRQGERASDAQERILREFSDEIGGNNGTRRSK